MDSPVVGEVIYGTELYTIIRVSTGDETPPIVNTRPQTTSRQETEHFEMKS